MIPLIGIGPPISIRQLPHRTLRMPSLRGYQHRLWPQWPLPHMLRPQCGHPHCRPLPSRYAKIRRRTRNKSSRRRTHRRRPRSHGRRHAPRYAKPTLLGPYPEAARSLALAAALSPAMRRSPSGRCPSCVQGWVHTSHPASLSPLMKMNRSSRSVWPRNGRARPLTLMLRRSLP